MLRIFILCTFICFVSYKNVKNELSLKIFNLNLTSRGQKNNLKDTTRKQLDKIQNIPYKTTCPVSIKSQSLKNKKEECPRTEENKET